MRKPRIQVWRFVIGTSIHGVEQKGRSEHETGPCLKLLNPKTWPKDHNGGELKTRTGLWVYMGVSENRRP